VSGERAERHFNENLGVPLANIRKGYSVVDNQHFYPVAEKEKKGKVLLCVARFSEEKNHRLLFNAFLKSPLSKTWKLTCVGSGPLQTEFQMRVKDQPDIDISEWVDYNALPALYASASAFILASRFEPWGLVVNEAMATGLPVIVSDACGCSPDLIGRENGWEFKMDSESSLINVFSQLEAATDHDLRERGLNSWRRIQYYSPDHWSSQLTELINHEIK
jgi:glycosyltransferase involved in cell wall biosynthesis